MFLEAVYPVTPLADVLGCTLFFKSGLLLTILNFLIVVFGFFESMLLIKDFDISLGIVARLY